MNGEVSPLVAGFPGVAIVFLGQEVLMYSFVTDVGNDEQKLCELT
jgi:hypothetical protein